MGGDLAVRSIADEGTVFSLHLTLPIFRQAASDQDEGRLQTPKVLLAEDTPLSRQVLSALLRAEGCVVVEAEDGDVAASNAMQTEFDLMILDMSMPGRSGLAVAEMIRRTDCCNRHTPIAIVTASNPKVFEADVAAVGIAHVLQKPIGRAEIRGILNTWAASAASRERQSEHLAQFSAEEIVLELHAALGSGEAAALLAQVESQIYSGMDALRQAIHSGDWVSGAASAHRLAGLAGQFGLSTLRCEALRLEALLETSTRAPTSEHVLSGLNGVEAVLRQTVWTSYGRTSGNPSLAKI
jgi:CheY-like chemotaxis protein